MPPRTPICMSRDYGSSCLVSAYRCRRYGPWHIGKKIGWILSGNPFSGCGNRQMQVGRILHGGMPGPNGDKSASIIQDDGKAKIRRAFGRALQAERWQATLQRHAGLLIRQLQFRGARTPERPSGQAGTTEVCGVCKMTFKDFRAWSVHAFKRHGRKAEARFLVEGLQCPHCLRHYATHIRLCRHIAYSAACRRALSGLNRSSPLPGQGSRKAPKEHMFCAPTLQAAGPAPPPRGEAVDDELNRPSAEVLDCLRSLDFDGLSGRFDPEEAWERIRRSFSCVCLPAARLRLTAPVWRDQLHASQGTPTPTGAFEDFLRQAADWVTETDFGEWLAPHPDSSNASAQSFLGRATALSSICTTAVTLPPIEAWTSEHVLVFIGDLPKGWPSRTADTNCVRYPHEESISCLKAGRNLDFLEEDPQECGFCINLCGLPSPTSPLPDTDNNPEESILALHLASDVTRLAFRFWSRGIRTCLFAPLPLGPDLSLLTRLPGIQRIEGEDRATIWVGQLNPPWRLFHIFN